MANTYTSNASLPKPIDESIGYADFENLQAAFSTAMDIIESNHSSIQTAANAGVNSSIIDSGGKSVVYLQHLSIGSITTIANVVVGKPFTLLVQSIGSYNILDAGNFVLSAAFTPAIGDTLTLVWDGTNYTEVARSSNG